MVCTTSKHFYNSPSFFDGTILEPIADIINRIFNVLLYFALVIGYFIEDVVQYNLGNKESFRGSRSITAYLFST